jgi:hypothetical protein
LTTSSAAKARSSSVLTIYVDLPDTPLQASASDQWLARRLYDESRAATRSGDRFAPGIAAPLIRPADAPRLSAIRSLAYFRPVIDELRTHPAPENYLDYLRLKLRQAVATLSANVQKSTFSNDR